MNLKIIVIQIIFLKLLMKLKFFNKNLFFNNKIKISVFPVFLYFFNKYLTKFVYERFILKRSCIFLYKDILIKFLCFL